MKKWSTNQLTVLNALASFLFNSMLGKLRATMGYYSLNTPVRLSQTSTRCYLWSSFTSLLVFTWWILYLNLSIFLPWEPDSSTLHVAGVNAEALPPAVLLEYSVRLTRASFLPSVLSLFIRVRLCDPVDCSPPGSSVRGILQARILEWGCHALLQGIFPTQGSNPHLSYLLHWHSYPPLPLAPPGKHSTVRKSSQGRACGCWTSQ